MGDEANEAIRTEEPTTETTSDDDPANADGATAAGDSGSSDKPAAEGAPVTSSHLEVLVLCPVSDPNFRAAVSDATEMDLRSALASGATARTLSRVVAIKRELLRRGLIVDLDAVPPEEERQEKRSGDAHCVTCHHVEHVHGDALQGRSSACMAIGCTCKRFVTADPLGVDDFDPAAEKGAAPCDSAS